MSEVKKISITLRGHRTSISLEQPFSECLKRIAVKKGLSLSALVDDVDNLRVKNSKYSLSSALRVFVLDYECANENSLFAILF